MRESGKKGVYLKKEGQHDENRMRKRE